MDGIIDSRVCPPIPAFLPDGTWADLPRTLTGVEARGWTPTESMRAPSLTGYFADCDASGVRLAGLTARLPNDFWGGQGNDSVFDACAQHPDRLFPYGAVDPFAADPISDVASLVSRGAKGIVVEPGLHPSRPYIDDPRVDPVYDACQSLSIPLLLMGGGETGPDLSHSDPLRFEQVAIRFPRLQLVYVHAGWPFVQVALGVAFRRENVWLLPDVYFPGLPGEQDYVLAMRTYLQDRFLFATNFPYVPIAEAIDRYQGFGVADDVIRKVLHDNAARLFGLP